LAILPRLAGASRDQRTSRARLDRAGAAAVILTPSRCPGIGSPKPASVSFLTRFLENLPKTYPELFSGRFAIR
jgi:hypothetical protein